jgi:DNA-binding NarL/FixJ family response regulator
MSAPSTPRPRRKSGRIKVVVADGHRLMIGGLRRALAASTDIEVVGEARSGAAVLPVVHETSPDVVLVDLDLPELDGFGCLGRLRRSHPDVKVILFANARDADVIARARLSGASGYILKRVEPADLAAGIEQAVEGSEWPVLGGAEDDVERPAKDAGLTEREIAILKGIARGNPSKMIAREDGVTEQAVKFHLTNIYRKLGVANRTQAARYAYALGLAQLPLVESA